MGKIIACAFIASLGAIAYAGSNAAGATTAIANSQTDYQARLACAENPTCNDLEEEAK